MGIELAPAALPLAIIAAIGVLVGRVAAAAYPLLVLSSLLLVQQVLGPVRGAVAYQVTRRVDGGVRARVMEVANVPWESAGWTIRKRSTASLAGGHIDPHWRASPGGAAVAFVVLGARYRQVTGTVVLLAGAVGGDTAGLTAAVLLAYRQCRSWNWLHPGGKRAAEPASFDGATSMYALFHAPFADERRTFARLAVWLRIGDLGRGSPAALWSMCGGSGAGG